MNSFGVYAGPEVLIAFGTVTLDDMRADEFLEITADEDAYVTVKGSDGSITRCTTGNSLFHATVRLKAASNTNQVLSAILQVDQIAGGGAGVASFFVKDPNGATIVTSEAAWLSKWPDFSKGKEVGKDVEWMFDMQILPGFMIIGGNQLT